MKNTELNSFVVTDPVLGWDCIVGVYKAKSEDILKKYLIKCHYENNSNYVENKLIIHSVIIETVK